MKVGVLTAKRSLISLSLLTLLLFTSATIGLAQTGSGNQELAGALEWVSGTKMVVNDPQDSVYNGTEPPQGGVFLTFSVAKAEFGTVIHIASAAEYVKLTADLYDLNHEKSIMSRLRLVGDFLLASTETVTINSGSVVRQSTVIFPAWLYKQGKGWVPYSEESYTRDNLNAAYTLLRAYQVTGSEGYASKARELLDTVMFVQSVIEQNTRRGEIADWASGSMPWLIFNYAGNLPYQLTLTDLDLSLTDVAWGAFTLGYNIFGTNQYLESRDQYFEFIARSYERTQKPRFPYQFISERASPTLTFANLNPVERSWGAQEPFTTDSAFYQVIGLLVNEDARYQEIGKGFLQRLTLLGRGYLFDDSYFPNGTSLDYGDAIIATALYLVTQKLQEDTAVDQITKIILGFELRQSSQLGAPIYDGAWEWSPHSGLVESMATIVTIHSLIFEAVMIPQTESHDSSLLTTILLVGLSLAASVTIIIVFTRKRSRTLGSTRASARTNFDVCSYPQATGSSSLSLSCQWRSTPRRYR